MRPKERENVCLFSLDQILNINDADDEHCSGVHIHTHFPFPFLLFLFSKIVQRRKEKGVNYIRMKKAEEEKLIIQQLRTVLNIKGVDSH